MIGAMGLKGLMALLRRSLLISTYGNYLNFLFFGTSTMSHSNDPSWTIMPLDSKLQYGDRITQKVTEVTGVIIGFMGKKRDQVIIRPESGDRSTFTMRSDEIVSVSRRPK